LDLSMWSCHDTNITGSSWTVSTFQRRETLLRNKSNE
jgi:hypothetical protein